MKTTTQTTAGTRLWLIIMAALALSAITPARAAGIEEHFTTNTSLTPKRFASLFVDFTFRFRPELQPRESFLLTQEGDCDDYATLAYDVLRQHGYTTRLVLIQMPNSAHMVTYVEETRTYLDYNNRACFLAATPKVRHGINEVADKLAKDAGTIWVSYSIADFKDGKVLVKSRITNPKYTPAPHRSMGVLFSSR